MIHTEPGGGQVSSDCGENFYGRLAVLVGLIVKISPWASLPLGGEGPPCQSLGGECAAKAWYGQLVSLENQFPDNVSALSLSCQLLYMFQADWPMKGLPGCEAVSGRSGGGGGMALNSLLRAGLSLKLPLSCRALKQLEMTKLRQRVSLNKYFFANQEPRRESP